MNRAEVIFRRLTRRAFLAGTMFLIFFVSFWVCWAPFVGPRAHGFPVVGPLYATGVYTATADDGSGYYFRCEAEVARRDGAPPQCFVPCDRWIGGGDASPALRYAEEIFAPPGTPFVLLHDARRCFLVTENGNGKGNEHVARWIFGIVLLGMASAALGLCVCFAGTMFSVARNPQAYCATSEDDEVDDDYC